MSPRSRSCGEKRLLLLLHQARRKPGDGAAAPPPGAAPSPGGEDTTPGLEKPENNDNRLFCCQSDFLANSEEDTVIDLQNLKLEEVISTITLEYSRESNHRIILQYPKISTEYQQKLLYLSIWFDTHIQELSPDHVVFKDRVVYLGEDDNTVKKDGASTTNSITMYNPDSLRKCINEMRMDELLTRIQKEKPYAVIFIETRMSKDGYYIFHILPECSSRSRNRE